MALLGGARAALEKLVSVLRRDRDLSVRELLEKLQDNALALATARFYLRGCHSVGARARCFGKPHVEPRGKITIGDDFALGGAFGTVHLSAAEGGVLAVGSGVTINYGTSLSARLEVKVGDRVKIGPYCVVADSEMPVPLDAPARSAPRAIHIGNDVWLGSRVTVLPGAAIGDGAVIAAGSVVGGPIPARSVASGSPARVLRINDAPPASGATKQTTPAGQKLSDVAAAAE
jgi:acetyltransferase-like isoleucine patch superfamily enzyme